MSEQAVKDQQNAVFWSELCGTSLAKALGIRRDDEDALERFDDAYFALYPYLKQYVDANDMRGQEVLEIGLGYGTLGQYIASRGAIYHAVDIAQAPVEMMRQRLRLLGASADERVRQGSALDLPFADGRFEYVFSVGCLHHTGDLQASVDEVHRVLAPGGTAVVMLYNRHSARQLWRVDRRRLVAGRARSGPSAEGVRAYYDVNRAGEAAPHTDFVSRRDARRLFRCFASVTITGENFDDVYMHRVPVLKRSWALRTPIPRLLGLDLYIVATKRPTGG